MICLTTVSRTSPGTQAFHSDASCLIALPLTRRIPARFASRKPCWNGCLPTISSSSAPARGVAGGTPEPCHLRSSFGSRARGGWNQYSDIDLLVVQAPDSAWNCIREQAYTLARSIFGQGMDIDLVYRTHRECHMQIEHSVNGIAAVALREGVAVEPYPAPLNDPDLDPAPELTEYGEMQLRIADANDNYDVLQYALDGGRESDSVAAHAHQVLEHALKALLSAQGNPYPYRRKLDELRQVAGINSLSMASALTQLDQYAGGDAYQIASNPIRDFAAMANAVTDDLILIYDRIERLTGQDAWSLQPPGIPNPIQPVYR